DALRVRAPNGQRTDAISLSEPRAAWAEGLDDADELVARRERRLGAVEVRAGSELGIGERHLRRRESIASPKSARRRGGARKNCPRAIPPARAADQRASWARDSCGRGSARGRLPAVGAAIPWHRNAASAG